MRPDYRARVTADFGRFDHTSEATTLLGAVRAALDALAAAPARYHSDAMRLTVRDADGRVIFRALRRRFWERGATAGVLDRARYCNSLRQM